MSESKISLTDPCNGKLYCVFSEQTSFGVLKVETDPLLQSNGNDSFEIDPPTGAPEMCE